jgi:hypothetical protein
MLRAAGKHASHTKSRSTYVDIGNIFDRVGVDRFDIFLPGGEVAFGEASPEGGRFITRLLHMRPLSVDPDHLVKGSP